jgi:hypothetical protein
LPCWRSPLPSPPVSPPGETKIVTGLWTGTSNTVRGGGGGEGFSAAGPGLSRQSPLSWHLRHLTPMAGLQVGRLADGPGTNHWQPASEEAHTGASKESELFRALASSSCLRSCGLRLFSPLQQGQLPQGPQPEPGQICLQVLPMMYKARGLAPLGLFKESKQCYHWHLEQQQRCLCT